MQRKYVSLTLSASIIALVLVLFLGRTERVMSFPIKELDFNIQAQQQSNWCWAAISVSMTKFYNSNSQLEQCSLVNNRLGRTDCCQDGSSKQCNQTQSIYKVLPQLGVSASPHAGQQSFIELSEQIQLGHPLVLILMRGLDAHYAVLSGVGANETVTIKDPMGGVTRKMSYQEFKKIYEQRYWKGSFFTKPTEALMTANTNSL